MNLDLDVLRSLVAGIELGSFAKAADRLGRSTSAVSAQLKRLEDQLGQRVVERSGRGVKLTATGEVVFAYARRLLDLNDEALLAARESTLHQEVRLGVLEDFSENFLADVLGQFVQLNPKLGIRADVARHAELLRQIEASQIDLALAWADDTLTPRMTQVARLPLCWIGRDGASTGHMFNKPIPLVTLDAPCPLRTLATSVLDSANLPWRMAFSSPNLTAVWAAVGAGLGVTVRTRAVFPGNLCVVEGLPPLPSIDLALHRSSALPSPAVRQLEKLLSAALDRPPFNGHHEAR